MKSQDTLSSTCQDKKTIDLNNSVLAAVQTGMNPQAGFGLLLTGLSGSGKTTLARCLVDILNDRQGPPAVILDGDYLRTTICADLGFNRQDRILNVQRAAHLAAKKIQDGQTVILSLIAPYAESRKFVRTAISQHGNFLEIHLSTPLSECMRRDPKGLYAKVQKGIIKNFTGVDDPYEAPESPNLSLDTTFLTVEESVKSILELLKLRALIS